MSTDNDTVNCLDSQNEEWKIAVGFEDYEVSDMGRVRLIKSPYAKCRGRILKPVMNGGYCQVNIGRGLQRSPVKVHRLVLMTFAGMPDEIRIWCNHKNGIRNDNRIENLEWVTPKENTEHSINVLGHHMKGEDANRAKLTNEEVIGIRRMAESGTGLRKIGRILKIPYSTVWYIVRRKSWSHI